MTTKKWLLAVALASLLLCTGKDITILTPRGNTYGYVEPNGDFLLLGPGNEASSGKLDTTQPLIPESNIGGSTFGYKDGDTTIILTPREGSAFLYESKPDH